MGKEIILSKDREPASSKYLIWAMDEEEATLIKNAIGNNDELYPLLSTLTDYREDFECVENRLLALARETVNLEISLEEHHRETPVLLKLLTLLGGLGALAHDQGLNIYGYAE